MATHVYRLDVTYPPRSQEPGWEPPGWEPDYTVGPGGSDDEFYQFRWPASRLCLSAATAKRRADLFRKYGAEVTVVRSLPVEWPAIQPADSPGTCPACGSEIRAERGYVPGFTGMPVTCGDEWHDEED